MPLVECRRGQATSAAYMTLNKRRNGMHTTPAMAAGLADRVWTVEDLLGLMRGTKLDVARCRYRECDQPRTSGACCYTSGGIALMTANLPSV